MSNQRIVELAAAIRMTCSNPDVIDKGGRLPLIVSLDDSTQALAFAAGRSCLQDVA
ncbi:MAG: hypothetical protein GF331_01160, partial [Chitinivibrionales bacterium]|nr:hypothetical protein [Chitinivibrionales bacterium]